MRLSLSIEFVTLLYIMIIYLCIFDDIINKTSKFQNTLLYIYTNILLVTVLYYQ